MRCSSRKAFTLIEMLVTVAILAIIGTSFYTIFQGSLVSSRRGLNLALVSSNLRAAMDYLVKDLKSAINPEISGRKDVYFQGADYWYQEGDKADTFLVLKFLIPETNGRVQIMYLHSKSIYSSTWRRRNVLFRVKSTNPQPTFLSLFPNYYTLGDILHKGFEPSGAGHPGIPVWGNYELALHIKRAQVFFGTEDGKRLTSWGLAGNTSEGLSLTDSECGLKYDPLDKASNRYRLPLYVNIKLTARYGKEDLGEIEEIVLEDTVFMK